MKKRLFHYTKLETLKLILESNKLRFTSLLNVDDKEEKWTKDMYDYGKHIFVCCFTDDEKESIPIWNMYAEQGKGVRLEFDGEIFNKFTDIKPVENNKEAKIIVALNKNVYPIIYTDDEEKLYPTIKKEVDGEFGHYIGELGIYKNTNWDFQKEWRYSLIIYKGYNINNKIMLDTRNIPVEYYDVNIKKNVFKNLKITLGYNIDYKEEEGIKDFIKRFNKKHKTNIEIKNSILKGKVK